MAGVGGGDEAEREEFVELANGVSERHVEEVAALGGDGGAAVGVNGGSGAGEASALTQIELVMTTAGAAGDGGSGARSAIGAELDTEGDIPAIRRGIHPGG